jgi:hypothetical protein
MNTAVITPKAAAPLFEPLRQTVNVTAKAAETIIARTPVA